MSSSNRASAFGIGRGAIEAPTVIIGAGIGGLTTAALLSARGVPVMVLEKEATPGGKVRQLDVNGSPIDAGPTVFTMRDVVDAIFEQAGTHTHDHLTLTKADTLARHAWDETSHLDLFADHEKNVDAIGRFAGAREAEGYRSFSAEAKRIFEILDQPFLQGSKTYPPGLMWRIGLGRFGALRAIRPYESLWSVLGEHFSDPRLKQLFGRYTTYCGSSPFHTPATLMLIAHVEAQGVWAIEGGMSALARALEQVGRRNGVRFRYGAQVERIETDRKGTQAVVLESGEEIRTRSVVCNADPSALGSGLFGEGARKAARPMRACDRSLSAMVWLVKSKTSGFRPEHHNVFFSGDYAAEFGAIRAGRVPPQPTAYVCALDHGRPYQGSQQRFQVIVNAPANGDTNTYSAEEKEQCTSNMLERLKACGLELETPLPHRLITPSDFSKLFPATGGALYGRASHGWAASFLRPGCRTKIPGLYCAGGATHPGAGVPMAALSGKLASEAVLSDRISTRWYHRRDTAGGMSMRSATTVHSG